MLDKYEYVFKVVISLSEKRSKTLKPNKTEVPFIDFTEIEENEEYDAISKKLLNFFQTLEYDTIKVLQTIMYLGRDKDYNEAARKAEIYKKEREYMDNIVGWKTKEVDIFQMVDKEPLYQYLKDGLEILGINYSD